MKTFTKKLIASVGAAFLLMGASSVAMGATSTLTLSATVPGTCQFSAATAALNFGTLDPTVSTDATVSVTPTIWCTKGTAYTVTPTGTGGTYAAGIYNGIMVSGVNSIPYKMVVNNPTGSGAGKSTTLPIKLDGTILNADYINVQIGAYTDTVTLTVSP